MVLIGASRYKDAEAVLEQAIPILRRTKDPSLPYALGNLATCETSMGDFNRAAALQEVAAGPPRAFKTRACHDIFLPWHFSGPTTAYSDNRQSG